MTDNKAGSAHIPRVWSAMQKTWDVTITAIALLTAVFLIMLTLEPTRALLEGITGPISVTLIAAIVGVMLEVAIIAMHQLGRQVKTASSAIERFAGGRVIYDIAEVLAEIRNQRPNKKGRQSIEVLGLTLGSTWTNIGPWLTSPNGPKDCKVKMYSLSPTFALDSPDLPTAWYEEAKRAQEKVLDDIQTESHALARNRIAVTLRQYSCVPVVHGFRFADGDLFVSYIQWSSSGRVHPFSFYERIPPSDESLRAERYRALFNSWIKRVDSQSATDDLATEVGTG